MTTVLVTDGDELAGLATARSLGRAGFDVTVALPAQKHRAPVRRSRWVSAVTRAPDPWEEVTRYETWLRGAVTEGRFDAVFPVSEASLVAAGRVFDRTVPVAVVMPDVTSRAASLSKYIATSAAQANGLAVPETALWYDGREFDDAAISHWRPPFVVKSDNAHTSHGTYRRGRTWVVRDARELSAVRSTLAGMNCIAIAQHLVPGRGVAFSCYAEGGQPLAECGHQRIHEVPWTGGVSSLRVSLHEGGVADAARRLLRGVGYTGLAMVEFRQGPDGVARFLEINGRPWGSMALALHAGVDFPRLALERTLAVHRGERVTEPVTAPPSGPRRTVWCMNLIPGELRHISSIVRSDELAGAQRWRVLMRSTGESVRRLLDPRLRHDHWWWTDPGPGLAQIGWLTRSLLSSKRRSRRRRHEARRDGVARPGFPRSPRSVLWVCSGNVCRSPFAERLFAAAAPETRSMSTGLHTVGGLTVPDWVTGFYADHGVAWSDHRSRPIDAEVVDDHDVIVCVELAHRRELIERFPAAEEKTWMIGDLAGLPVPEVADPYMADAFAAAAVFDELTVAVSLICDRLGVSSENAARR